MRLTIISNEFSSSLGNWAKNNFLDLFYTHGQPVERIMEVDDNFLQKIQTLETCTDIRGFDEKFKQDFIKLMEGIKGKKVYLVIASSVSPLTLNFGYEIIKKVNEGMDLELSKEEVKKDIVKKFQEKFNEELSIMFRDLDSSLTHNKDDIRDFLNDLISKPNNLREFFNSFSL